MAAILYIYDRPNLDDNSPLQVTSDIPNLKDVKHGLGNWNDELESFNVVSGQWEFYADINYGGTKVGPFGPGKVGNVESVGIPKQWVSSIKKVSD